MPEEITGSAPSADPQDGTAVDTDTASPDTDTTSLDTAADTGEAAKPPKKRHRVRNTLLSLLVLVVLAAAGVAAAATYDVHKLTKSIKHTALLPPGVTEPAEPVDAFGDSPINILLIGSDSRDTSADAALGGDAGSGARADSEMVVHLSADRSNATVISIPRDTVTRLPACAGGADGMVNSALAFGASCQVEAIHQLTGLTVDHYVLFDFSGVVSISQDVGGIPVCVSANIQDPNSGLKLDQGFTHVQGKQALQFLRTRDAFYDGSDIGRERATHYFFSQLIQQMKASASFTNVGELQSLAEDVTRYTTVDDGLDSASALIGLGEDLNKVPTDRITFLIMPWVPDPADANRVVPDDPSAQSLFHDIAGDQSFTTTTTVGAATSPSGLPVPSGAPAAPPPSASGAASPTGTAPSEASSSSGGSPSGTVSPSAIASPSATASPTGAALQALKASESAAALTHPMKVAVVNSSGTTGRAATVVQQLFQDGFVYAEGSDATTTTTVTTLEYEPSEAAAAQELAADLQLPASALQSTGGSATMTLVIGSDWSIGATYPDTQAGASPAFIVPTDSYEQNASTTGGCITANPLYEF